MGEWKGMCIVWKLGFCLGCNGFEEDIDKVKKYCETYKNFMRRTKDE